MHLHKFNDIYQHHLLLAYQSQEIQFLFQQQDIILVYKEA